jgi:1-deoxy-D-xylulose-5-phosphate synthase
MWDVGFFGLVPGVRVAAPRDPEQLRVLPHECVACDEGPTVLRFPRGDGGRSLPSLGAWGSASVLWIAPDAQTLLLPVGPLAEAALDAADELLHHGVPAVVADPRWVRPLDPELVEAAARFRDVFTVEDNAPSGGFEDTLARKLRQARAATRLHSLTLPADFVAAGSRDELLHAHGLDADGIVNAVLATLKARGVPAGRSPAAGGAASTATVRPASG